MAAHFSSNSCGRRVGPSGNNLDASSCREDMYCLQRNVIVSGSFTHFQHILKVISLQVLSEVEESLNWRKVKDGIYIPIHCVKSN